MAKQKEGSLQERIQTLIEKRGGWVIKEWGNMTKRPGIPDLLFCYKGLFCAIEAKIENNEASRQQEIQLRKIKKSGGLIRICWSIKDAEDFLNEIDKTLSNYLDDGWYFDEVLDVIIKNINNSLRNIEIDLGGKNGNI